MSEGIVYFLGAGASKHVHDDVPLVNDFFKKCLPYLEEGPVWAALVTLEWYRVFETRVPELENFAAAIWLTEDSKQAGLAKLYAEKFRNCKERHGENLETVFTRAEHVFQESGDERPLKRLRILINFLFAQIDRKAKSGKAYEDLAATVRSDLEAASGFKQHVFVSYNYDLWLEKSLFSHGVWGPTLGYGHIIKHCVDPLGAIGTGAQHAPLVNIAEQNPTQLGNAQVRGNRVFVIKPHGSLSWFWSSDDPSRIALMLEDATGNSNVKYHEKYWLAAVQIGGEFTQPNILEPLIVPPVPAKQRSHPFFWETDKQLQLYLDRAETIVVIGWSLPEADVEQRSAIEHVMRHRCNQVQRLVVCDVSEHQAHYAKFERLFRPENGMDDWRKGFTPEFVRYFAQRYLNGGPTESSELLPATQKSKLP
jgi:hypothetical protein